MRCLPIALVLGMASTSVTGGCGASPPTVPARAGEPSGPATIASNILRADYVGSAECKDCHLDLWKTWSASPMHNMTRVAMDATIRAPFDGETFKFKGESVALSTFSGEHVMTVTTDGPPRAYKVTKVIGGRTREDFVGRLIEPVGGEPGGEEVVLPVSWIFATHSWRYKGYSVMVRERPKLEVGPVWRQTCIFCHNTAPYLSTVFDDVAGPKAPVYQGSVADRLLPADKIWQVRVLDADKLAAAMLDEVHFLGGARPPAGASLVEVARTAIASTHKRFGERHLVEVGIGCEACHLGARAHADDPKLRPALAPQSPLLAMGPPSPTHAEQVNHVCARCHTVLFSHYDFTWEGGHRDANGGGSTINSGEARDFLLGHCASQLACTACHDPHTEDPRAKLDAMGTPAGNALCTSCHPKFATPEASAAHSHHRADGPGGACLACHMAKKNMGLGYGLTRYHRIGSPTDTERVEKDRPMECALCHADQSVASLTATLDRWWGKRYDPNALRALYGDLDANILDATLARGWPHEQAAAAQALAAQHVTAAIPKIIPLLVSEYPLVRRFAQKALADLSGRALDIDLDAPAADIVAAAQRELAPTPR